MTQVFPEFEGRAHFKVTDYIIEKDVTIDDLLEDQNADVVVSAGSNVAYLQSKLSLPVLGLEVSDGDILESLLKADKIDEKILLITFSKDCRVLELVRPLLSAEVVHHVYSTPDEAREIFYLAAKQIPGVVIGSSYVCDLAEQQKVKSILIYSKDSCRKLIEAAILKGEETFAENLNKAIYTTVLEGTGVPVLTVDFSGGLLSYNESALSRMGLVGEPDVLRLIEFLNSKSAGRSSQQAMTVEWDGQVLSFSRSMLMIKEKKRGYIYSSIIESKIDSTVPKSEVGNRMVYASTLMKHINEVIKAYSVTKGTVLITGETGTGKELIAREIHRNSPYSKGEFIAINCGAIPEELFESEIFGYVEGAFTASRRGGRIGLLETANNGVFFMDEISELPLSQQAKMLRVMQERKIRPLGTNKEIPIQVKFICASNQDLASCVKAGTFREDLFYRIHVFSVKLPSLKERPDDIFLIGRYFAKRFNEEYGLAVNLDILFPLLEKQMFCYHWPGNVRELENAIERLLVSYSTFSGPDDFMASLPSIMPEWYDSSASGNTKWSPVSGAIKEQEINLIKEVMDHFNGDKAKVADYLGISKTTLWRRLKAL